MNAQSVSIVLPDRESPPWPLLRLDVLSRREIVKPVASVTSPTSWTQVLTRVDYRRRVAIVLYLVAVGASVSAWGFPLKQDRLFLLIVLGLLVGTIGEWRRGRTWARIVVDWLPLFLLLTVYDMLRKNVADLAHAHVVPQLHVDQWLGGGVPLTVRLQQGLFTPSAPHWWDYLAFFVYLSHFVIPIAVAALLWKFSYERFHRYAFLFVSLTVAGFATYAAFPADPPWLASLHGVLPPTTKIIDDIWIHLGLRSATSVLSSNSHLANPVAAMPSLHGAYPFLLMLFFWQSAGRYRWLLLAYPAAMAFTLVYSAEHFVIDIIVGWIYATAVYVIGGRIFERWIEKRLHPATSDTAPISPTVRA